MTKIRPGACARAFFIAWEIPLSFRPIGLVILGTCVRGICKGALLAQATCANILGKTTRRVPAGRREKIDDGYDDTGTENGGQERLRW